MGISQAPDPSDAYFPLAFSSLHSCAATNQRTSINCSPLLKSRSAASLPGLEFSTLLGCSSCYVSYQGSFFSSLGVCRAQSCHSYLLEDSSPPSTHHKLSEGRKTSILRNLCNLVCGLYASLSSFSTERSEELCRDLRSQPAPNFFATRMWHGLC